MSKYYFFNSLPSINDNWKDVFNNLYICLYVIKNDQTNYIFILKWHWFQQFINIIIKTSSKHDWNIFLCLIASDPFRFFCFIMSRNLFWNINEICTYPTLALDSWMNTFTNCVFTSENVDWKSIHSWSYCQTALYM